MGTKRAGAGLGRAAAIALALLVWLPLVSPASAQAPGAAPPDYWLLTEFDWGDDPEVVADSIRIAPGWLCFRFRADCRFVKVLVDGEEMLARFRYVARRLTEITFITPELTRQQADEHLARVWRSVAGYVERFKGPADVVGAMPSLDALSAEKRTPTHYWSRPDLQIRIELGREGDLYFLAVLFSPPYAAGAGGR